jgi:uncharacterized membrane protein YfcA
VFIVGLILSLAIGLSLGLLGGGGSILTVPVLHYVFGVEAHAAIAMSLVVVGVTSAIAMIPHARAGCVRWRTGLTFGASSMAAAFVGGHLGAKLPGTVLMLAFASLMLVAGVVMLVRSLRKVPPRQRSAGSPTKIALIGVCVGFVTGVLGAGGGFIIVPALTLVAGLAIVDAIGTSLLVITLNSVAGLAGVASRAHLDVVLTLVVVAMAVTGSVLGARMCRRLSAQNLARAFGGFVVVVGLFMLAKQIV